MAFTRHGHHIPNTENELEPPIDLARCGGVGMCPVCTKDASAFIKKEEKVISNPEDPFNVVLTLSLSPHNTEEFRQMYDLLSAVLSEFSTKAKMASLSSTNLDDFDTEDDDNEEYEDVEELPVSEVLDFLSRYIGSPMLRDQFARELNEQNIWLYRLK